MENLKPIEFYLRDVMPNNPKSVLDVGLYHSDIFNGMGSLPFNNEEYDVIKCLNVIEHISQEKRYKFIANYVESLKI